jgi:hypothetical protein
VSRERRELISAPFGSSLAERVARRRKSQLKLSGARCSFLARLCFRVMGREKTGRVWPGEPWTRSPTQFIKGISGSPQPKMRGKGSRTWTVGHWARGVSLPSKVGSGSNSSR